MTYQILEQEKGNLTILDQSDRETIQFQYFCLEIPSIEAILLFELIQVVGKCNPFSMGKGFGFLEENFQMVFSDEKILLMGEQPNLLVRLAGEPEAQTNEVSIKGVGETSFEMKSKNSNTYQLIEFALYITLQCTVPDLGLYSKIIEIAPRYVIINETEYTLEI